jgi:hypothetical protein
MDIQLDIHPLPSLPKPMNQSRMSAGQTLSAVSVTLLISSPFYRAVVPPLKIIVTSLKGYSADTVGL